MSKLTTPGLFIVLLASLNIILVIALAACYWDRGWLSIQSAADLAQIFGSLAVAFSLLFIAVQLRQQTRLARGSNSQAFVSASSSFVLAVGCNPDVMNLYSTGGAKFYELPEEKQAQYRYLVSWWLTFYENVVYQNGIGLLDKGVYYAWMKDMNGFVSRRRVERVWGALKDNYSEEFKIIFQDSIDAWQKALSESSSTDSSGAQVS
jgi:hypothetical protein